MATSDSRQADLATIFIEITGQSTISEMQQQAGIEGRETTPDAEAITTYVRQTIRDDGLEDAIDVPELF